MSAHRWFNSFSQFSKPRSQFRFSLHGTRWVCRIQFYFDCMTWASATKNDFLPLIYCQQQIRPHFEITLTLCLIVWFSCVCSAQMYFNLLRFKVRLPKAYIVCVMSGPVLNPNIWSMRWKIVSQKWNKSVWCVSTWQNNKDLS